MDYLAKIKEKDLEFQELDSRMQQDTDLLYLKKYVLTDASGRHAVPDIINATLNKPAVLAANVISGLGAVKQQVTVESESRRVETDYIEEFIEAVLEVSNQYLRKADFPLLNPFADTQLCIRGRTGRRVTCQFEGNWFIPEIIPWDGRYIRYEMAGHGLDWASYSTTRTKGEIEQEYGIIIKSETGKVIDVWDREHNEVWVDNRIVTEQEHDYGYVPVVFSKVPLGYGEMLLDPGHLKHEGDSIFMLIRDIIPQLNMVLSILQTLNFLSVKRPMNYESVGGKDATPPEYDEAVAPGVITASDIGGGLKPIDFGDATRAAQMAYAMLEKASQEGGYTDTDIGNAQQPFSAVALITLGESRDQIYLPRLAAKEWLNNDTAEMVIKQVLQYGGTVTMGDADHSRSFNTDRLRGDYKVRFKYYTKSEKTEVARMALASQAKEWYPRKHIYKEVLKVEDPEGLEKDYYSEMAEKLDPNILKHRIIMKLLDMAEEGDKNAALEAKIMAAGMGLDVAQVKAGLSKRIANTAMNDGGSATPGSAVPLLPPGGRVGGIVPPVGNKPAVAMTAG